MYSSVLVIMMCFVAISNIYTHLTHAYYMYICYYRASKRANWPWFIRGHFLVTCDLQHDAAVSPCRYTTAKAVATQSHIDFLCAVCKSNATKPAGMHTSASLALDAHLSAACITSARDFILLVLNWTFQPRYSPCTPDYIKRMNFLS